MDINEQLQPIITSIIDNVRVNIEQEIKDRVSQEIINKIADTEITDLIQKITSQQLEQRLANQNFEATTKKELDSIVKRSTETLQRSLAKQADEQISNAVHNYISKLDVRAVISELVKSNIQQLFATGAIPSRSIPHESINFQSFSITGDRIKGGIIENFGSTGIEDLAKSVKLSILDTATVCDNPLFAPMATIKGRLVVEGDLTLHGNINTESTAVKQITELTTARVREGLNQELFQGFSDTVSKTLNEQGLDLDKIKQGGREVISGNQLGYHIVDSNLQRLGLVKDLQTQGESYLCDTLYVTGRRVGINTMEPDSALSIWDDEIEIVAEKRTQDTGFFGSKRNQRLVLGSNNKTNIVLNPDGTVEVDTINIGNVPMSSASVAPNYESITGTIVWNESAGPGGYAGWICVGGARWSKFGKIE